MAVERKEAAVVAIIDVTHGVVRQPLAPTGRHRRTGCGDVDVNLTGNGCGHRRAEQHRVGASGTTTVQPVTSE